MWICICHCVMKICLEVNTRATVYSWIHIFVPIGTANRSLKKSWHRSKYPSKKILEYFSSFFVEFYQVFIENLGWNLKWINFFRPLIHYLKKMVRKTIIPQDNSKKLLHTLGRWIKFIWKVSIFKSKTCLLCYIF